MKKQTTPLSPRLSQMHFDAIIDAIGDGITVHDREFRIIYQNPVMQEVFGNRIGEICHSAYEQNDAICGGCPMTHCFLDGETHESEKRIMVNGRLMFFENRAAPLRDEQGCIVAAVEVVRDVTVRKESEERIIRFRDLYAAISHTNKAIIQCINAQDLYDQICRIAVEFGGFSLSSINLLQDDGSLTSVAHYGVAFRYLDSLTVHSDADRVEGQGPTGRAIREGQPYICNDFHRDTATAPWRSAALENNIRSSAAFPLWHEERIIGVLKVYADCIDFFDDGIVELLIEMSANISFALDNFTREERRKAAENSLRDREEQLKLVLEGSSDGFCDWRIDQGKVLLSNRYSEILGYQSCELEQSPNTIKGLVHPEDWPLVEDFLNDELISRHPSFEIEVRMREKSGGWKWIRHRGKVVEWDENGNAARVAGTGTDITDKMQYLEQLRHANTHDQLTGLFNRFFFDAEIDRMKSSRQYPVSIVMADIDNLKLVNDSFGHTAGDSLIRHAAQVLRESFRGEDVVARIGGDEFAAILPSADAETVKAAIKRVLVSQEEINHTDVDYSVSISLGSATAENADQLNEALRLADSRMYYYKRKRKDR